jgi:hypothetical protein
VPGGSPLACYLAWSTFVQGSPEAYHLANVLVFAAYTLARRGFYLETALEEIHPSLWFALLGDSGAGKTTSIDMAERFARAAWKEAGLDVVSPFVEPSGSIPGILNALQDHYDVTRGTTVAILQHDELAQVFATREPIAELLCKLCDGRDVSHNTKTARKDRSKAGHAEKLLSPRISAIFASTEAQLADHFRAAHRSGGMFGRLQWIRAPLEDRYVRASSHDPTELAEASRRRVAAVQCWADWEGRLSELQSSGTALKLTAEAADLLHEQLFVPFRHALGIAQNTDALHGVRMRLVRRAQVLATIFATCDLRLDVEVEDARLAVALAQRLYGHTFAASDLGSSEHNRNCRKIEEIVLSFGEMGCQRRWMYARLRVDKRTLDEVLETLADREVVVLDRHRGGQSRYVHTSTQIGERALAVERKSRTITESIHRSYNEPRPLEPDEPRV